MAKTQPARPPSEIVPPPPLEPWMKAWFVLLAAVSIVTVQFGLGGVLGIGNLGAAAIDSRQEIGQAAIAERPQQRQDQPRAARADRVAEGDRPAVHVQAVGFQITAIKDVTPIPHNGCRPRKRRRV